MPAWRSSPGGVLWTDQGEFKLVVHTVNPDDGTTRFSVLRRQYGAGSPFALVAAGTRPSRSAAKQAAMETLAEVAPAAHEVPGAGLHPSLRDDWEQGGRNARSQEGDAAA